MNEIDPLDRINTGDGFLDQLLRQLHTLETRAIFLLGLGKNNKSAVAQIPPIQAQIKTLKLEIDAYFKRSETEKKTQQDYEETQNQAKRDHEEKLAIIAHETARENRLAAEATAKVAATAQEQASQSLDSLLKGLQGNGEG